MTDRGASAGPAGPRSLVAVTGASGFLGVHACAGLAAAGYDVRAVVRQSRGASWPAGVSEVVASLDAPRALRDAFSGASAVVHLAGRAHVAERARGAGDGAFALVNEAGTRQVLEALIEAGVPHLVHTSSIAAVASTADALLSEASPPRPSSAYGVSKLNSEVLVRRSCEAAGVGFTIFRPPMIYGPGMKGNPLRLFELVARGVPVPVCASPNRRTVLFAGNFVAAIVRVLALSPSNLAFHLGDSMPVSTESLARMVAAALGRPARIVRLPDSLVRLVTPHSQAGPPSSVIGRTLERLCGSLVLDTSLFGRFAAFAPPVATEDGLRATAEWYQGRSRP